MSTCSTEKWNRKIGEDISLNYLDEEHLDGDCLSRVKAVKVNKVPNQEYWDKETVLSVWKEETKENSSHRDQKHGSLLNSNRGS